MKPTDEERAEGAATPAGLVHLPIGLNAEWIKQLVAEQLITIKTKRGFQRLEWQKMRERNEALDCRVYARAAAWIAGADRWTEAMWRDLEQQVGVCAEEGEDQPTEAAATADNIAGLIRRGPQRQRRRVFRSTYMSC